MDQTQFDFSSEEVARTRRRRAGRRRQSKPPPEPSPVLVDAPFLQRCGFCGHHQTVLARGTLCDQCGGIIVRNETEE